MSKILKPQGPKIWCAYLPAWSQTTPSRLQKQPLGVSVIWHLLLLASLLSTSLASGFRLLSPDSFSSLIDFVDVSSASRSGLVFKTFGCSVSRPNGAWRQRQRTNLGNARTAPRPCISRSGTGPSQGPLIVLSLVLNKGASRRNPVADLTNGKGSASKTPLSMRSLASSTCSSSHGAAPPKARKSRGL